MTFRHPETVRPAALPRRVKILLGVMVTLIVLAVLLAVVSSVWTDWLWYRSVDFTGVFTTRLGTQILLFSVFGLVSALLVGANAVIAHRLRPPVRLAAANDPVERWRMAVDPRRRGLLVALLVAVFLLVGSSAAGHWSQWLLWRHAVPFGTRDAQFGKDISYFVMTYPIQRMLLGFAFGVVILSLLVAAAVHVLYGGIHLPGPAPRTSPGARAHLSVLIGFFLLGKAVAYWLDRYGLAFSPRGIVTGPSYTDVHAVLPAKGILAIVAVICAGLFFANAFRPGWTLPLIGFGLLVLSAVVIGGIYPAILQRFVVTPSEAAKERPYIQRMIDGTRSAYHLETGSGVTYTNYPQPGATLPAAASVRNDQGTLPLVRLLDPNKLRATWQQLQGAKQFYAFPDTLDIDRYPTTTGPGGAATTEQVLGVRDIAVEGLAANQANWINQHLVYTHGYGAVAAPSNVVDAAGQPMFSVSGLPVQSTLTPLEQPRVYFGENSPTYSIVGGKLGGIPVELDYPDSTVPNGQRNNTYTGSGGVPIGSPVNRLLYALRFQEKNILLSGGVNADSRILYVRNPRDRVQQVAPWLTLDSDVYPTLVNGRIVWVLDGYTTTANYPYSQPSSLGVVTSDSLTQVSANLVTQTGTRVDYMRNAVKATVDAYDGTVKLYAWDSSDPLLKAWSAAFPGTVHPKSDIPAALLSHMRYPEDMFKVQRDVLTRVHVSDPQTFYNGSEFWKVPTDPTATGSLDQPPYYLSLQFPGTAKPSFQLTTTLLANNNRSLASFVSVESDPTSPDYGKLRVLQISGDNPVDGPGQVFNNFESFPPASKDLTLLKNGGSAVDYGNLLALPVGGRFLYVEPIYVKATGATSFPSLQKVLVSYNNSIGYADTYAAALDQAFGVAASGSVGSGSGGGGSGSGGGGSATGTVSQQISAAIAAASQAYADGVKALAANDFAAYGDAQKRLSAALTQLAALEKQLPAAASPSPASSGSPSGPASPSPSG